MTPRPSSGQHIWERHETANNSRSPAAHACRKAAVRYILIADRADPAAPSALIAQLPARTAGLDVLVMGYEWTGEAGASNWWSQLGPRTIHRDLL
ncbi:MAG: hypothetical protein ACTS5I_02275, partial [Rhodanobacter sp.]